MKLYRITYWAEGTGTIVEWKGTIDSAKSRVKDLKSELPPEADPEWKPHDVPTDKPGLLAWLSLYCNRENG